MQEFIKLKVQKKGENHVNNEENIVVKAVTMEVKMTTARSENMEK